MTAKTIRSIQMISVRWWNANAYYAVSLAEALQKAGRIAAVCGRSTSPALQKAMEKNLDRIDTVNFESVNPLLLLSSLGKLIRQIRSRQINILAAHRSQDVLFAFLAKRKMKNTVRLIRCVSDVRPPKNNALNRYIHEKAVDYLVFSCQALRQKYIDVWPFVAEKSRVVYSAVDTERFTPDHPGGLKEKLDIAEESIVISMIARLSPVKNHLALILSAREVIANNPDCTFIISGEEFEIDMNYFKDEVGKHDLEDHFRFLGKVDDVRDLISITDIGVIPSEGSEVVCRIALEFMAMGKPLVVSDVNILPEIVDEGQNGHVFAIEDDPNFSANLTDFSEILMLLTEDGENRRLFGKRAREICEEKYSYPVLVREMEAVYETVLNSQQTEV